MRFFSKIVYDLTWSSLIYQTIILDVFYSYAFIYKWLWMYAIKLKQNRHNIENHICKCFAILFQYKHHDIIPRKLNHISKTLYQLPTVYKIVHRRQNSIQITRKNEEYILNVKWRFMSFFIELLGPLDSCNVQDALKTAFSTQIRRFYLIFKHIIIYDIL
jgi:hypothetical protein